MSDTDLLTEAIHTAIETRTREIADEEAKKAAAATSGSRCNSRKEPGQ